MRQENKDYLIMFIENDLDEIAYSIDGKDGFATWAHRTEHPDSTKFIEYSAYLKAQDKIKELETKLAWVTPTENVSLENLVNYYHDYSDMYKLAFEKSEKQRDEFADECKVYLKEKLSLKEALKIAVEGLKFYDGKETGYDMAEEILDKLKKMRIE